jgi:hypothetical protein
MPSRNAERAAASGVAVIGVDDVHDALEALGVR